jgi:dipeptidase E
VAGGNTFILRKALLLSGADKLLRQKVEDEEFVYGGESAGSVIVTPTLQGVEFGDDPYLEVEGYPDIDVWDGLGLVEYSIVPHYESDWMGAEKMVDILEEENMPYKTLTDAQVLIVVDNSETILS